MGMHVHHHGGRGRKGRFSLNNEINVTPLVDVMLVLLIIFMVTSPLLVSGIHVDLPETSASPLSGQDEPLSITVDAKGQVYIQDSPIELQELPMKLRAITREKMDSRIFVSGDEAIHYGLVVAVMDAVTQAGFTKVALVTTVKDGKARRK